VKIKIVLSVFVLGAIVALSMFYLNGSAGAADTGTVSPSVTVDSTLSLTIENGTNVQWGHKSANDTYNGIIQAKVGANTAWRLMVRRTSDPTIDCGLKGANGDHIASSNFTFTSDLGSPQPSGSGVTTPREFLTTNTEVWTGGGATDQCRVAITYNLVIPASQYAQAYTATHTYTVVSS